MNVLVSGSTGFIGSALVAHLSREGHDVTRLVRAPRAPEERQVRWDLEKGVIDAEGLAGMDAVVHLAGESIAGRRWTASHKSRILRSRVDGTKLLCEALSSLETPPRVLACASARDFYGDRGEEALSEDSPQGRGFLAEVISEWEAATEAASRNETRVVNLRFAMVLGRAGGYLGKMLPLFRLGLGGTLGNGAQYMSWVSITDAVRSISHAISSESMMGPVNVVAPGVVTNAEFTKTLGRVLSRPALFRTPGFVLRVVLGEVAHVLLSSARMEPAKLAASGFAFQHPKLEQALRSEVT